MAVVIQLRRGAETEWSDVNPVLKEGEVGVELDTGKFKIGDGMTAWNSLDYSSGGQGDPIGNFDGGRPFSVYANLQMDGGPV